MCPIQAQVTTDSGFDQPASDFEVQIESANGICPFLVETDENDNRLTDRSVEETVEILTRLLHIELA